MYQRLQSMRARINISFHYKTLLMRLDPNKFHEMTVMNSYWKIQKKNHHETAIDIIDKSAIMYMGYILKEHTYISTCSCKKYIKYSNIYSNSICCIQIKPKIVKSLVIRRASNKCTSLEKKWCVGLTKYYFEYSVIYSIKTHPVIQANL